MLRRSEPRTSTTSFIFLLTEAMRTSISEGIGFNATEPWKSLPGGLQPLCEEPAVVPTVEAPRRRRWPSLGDAEVFVVVRRTTLRAWHGVQAGALARLGHSGGALNVEQGGQTGRTLLDLLVVVLVLRLYRRVLRRILRLYMAVLGLRLRSPVTWVWAGGVWLRLLSLLGDTGDPGSGPCVPTLISHACEPSKEPRQGRPAVRQPPPCASSLPRLLPAERSPEHRRTHRPGPQPGRSHCAHEAWSRCPRRRG